MNFETNSQLTSNYDADLYLKSYEPDAPLFSAATDEAAANVAPNEPLASYPPLPNRVSSRDDYLHAMSEWYQLDAQTRTQRDVIDFSMASHFVELVRAADSDLDDAVDSNVKHLSFDGLKTLRDQGAYRPNAMLAQTLDRASNLYQQAHDALSASRRAFDNGNIAEGDTQLAKFHTAHAQLWGMQQQYADQLIGVSEPLSNGFKKAAVLSASLAVATAVMGPLIAAYAAVTGAATLTGAAAAGTAPTVGWSTLVGAWSGGVALAGSLSLVNRGFEEGARARAGLSTSSERFAGNVVRDMANGAQTATVAAISSTGTGRIGVAAAQGNPTAGLVMRTYGGRGVLGAGVTGGTELVNQMLNKAKHVLKGGNTPAPEIDAKAVGVATGTGALAGMASLRVNKLQSFSSAPPEVVRQVMNIGVDGFAATTAIIGTNLGRNVPLFDWEAGFNTAVNIVAMNHGMANVMPTQAKPVPTAPVKAKSEGAVTPQPPAGEAWSAPERAREQHEGLFAFNGPRAPQNAAKNVVGDELPGGTGSVKPSEPATSTPSATSVSHVRKEHGGALESSQTPAPNYALYTLKRARSSDAEIGSLPGNEGLTHSDLIAKYEHLAKPETQIALHEHYLLRLTQEKPDSPAVASLVERTRDKAANLAADFLKEKSRLEADIATESTKLDALRQRTDAAMADLSMWIHSAEEELRTTQQQEREGKISEKDSTQLSEGLERRKSYYEYARQESKMDLGHGESQLQRLQEELSVRVDRYASDLSWTATSFNQEFDALQLPRFKSALQSVTNLLTSKAAPAALNLPAHDGQDTTTQLASMAKDYAARVKSGEPFKLSALASEVGSDIKGANTVSRLRGEFKATADTFTPQKVERLYNGLRHDLPETQQSGQRKAISDHVKANELYLMRLIHLEPDSPQVAQLVATARDRAAQAAASYTAQDAVLSQAHETLWHDSYRLETIRDRQVGPLLEQKREVEVIYARVLKEFQGGDSNLKYAVRARSNQVRDLENKISEIEGKVLANSTKREENWHSREYLKRVYATTLSDITETFHRDFDALAIQPNKSVADTVRSWLPGEPGKMPAFSDFDGVPIKEYLASHAGGGKPSTPAAGGAPLPSAVGAPSSGVIDFQLARLDATAEWVRDIKTASSYEPVDPHMLNLARDVSRLRGSVNEAMAKYNAEVGRYQEQISTAEASLAAAKDALMHAKNPDRKTSQTETPTSFQREQATIVEQLEAAAVRAERDKYQAEQSLKTTVQLAPDGVDRLFREFQEESARFADADWLPPAVAGLFVQLPRSPITDSGISRSHSVSESGAAPVRSKDHDPLFGGGFNGVRPGNEVKHDLFGDEWGSGRSPANAASRTGAAAGQSSAAPKGSNPVSRVRSEFGNSPELSNAQLPADVRIAAHERYVMGLIKNTPDSDGVASLVKTVQGKAASAAAEFVRDKTNLETAIAAKTARLNEIKTEMQADIGRVGLAKAQAEDAYVAAENGRRIRGANMQDLNKARDALSEADLKYNQEFENAGKVIADRTGEIDSLRQQLNDRVAHYASSMSEITEFFNQQFDAIHQASPRSLMQVARDWWSDVPDTPLNLPASNGNNMTAQLAAMEKSAADPVAEKPLSTAESVKAAPADEPAVLNTAARSDTAGLSRVSQLRAGFPDAAEAFSPRTVRRQLDQLNNPDGGKRTDQWTVVSDHVKANERYLMTLIHLEPDTPEVGRLVDIAKERVREAASNHLAQDKGLREAASQLDVTARQLSERASNRLSMLAEAKKQANAMTDEHVKAIQLRELDDEQAQLLAEAGKKLAVINVEKFDNALAIEHLQVSYATVLADITATFHRRFDALFVSPRTNASAKPVAAPAFSNFDGVDIKEHFASLPQNGSARPTPSQPEPATVTPEPKAPWVEVQIECVHAANKAAKPLLNNDAPPVHRAMAEAIDELDAHVNSIEADKRLASLRRDLSEEQASLATVEKALETARKPPDVNIEQLGSRVAFERERQIVVSQLQGAVVRARQGVQQADELLTRANKSAQGEIATLIEGFQHQHPSWPVFLPGAMNDLLTFRSR